MKRNLLMVAALALSASAVFAQDATTPGYSVQPENEKWPAESLVGTATFVFDQDVLVSQAVAMSGAWGMGDFQIIEISMEKPGKKVVVPVDESCWGDPVMDTFYLNIMIPEVLDADGNVIMEGEDPWMPTVSYQCANSFPARFLHAVPDPKAFSAAGAYSNTAVSFLYSQEIALAEDATALITYEFEGDEIEKLLLKSDLQVSQDEYTGVWNVMVPVLDDAIVGKDGANPSEEELTSMTIVLSGVTRLNPSTVIETPAQIYQQYSPLDEGSAFRTPSKKGAKQTGLSLISVDETADVYNVHGMRVATVRDTSEFNNLPAGIYIVNGKKIVIK